MKNLLRSTYLRKFLISYIAIFFIPFVIFSSIFQFRYKSVLEEELIKNSNKQMTALETYMTNEIEQLDMIVNQNIINRILVPFEFEKNPMVANERIDTLKRYTQTNAFIEEMLLYYNDNDFIYSSESSHKLSTTFSKVYAFSEWPLEQMISDLNYRSSKFFIARTPLEIYTKSDIDFYTVISYPLTNEGLTFYGNLLFLINEKTLENMIGNIYNDDNNLTIILDDSQEIIHKKGNLSFENIDFDKDFMDGLDSVNSYITSEKGEEFLVTYTHSDDYDWTYVNITSVSTALHASIETQRTFFVVSILMFILGIFLILLMLKSNYRPIRTLSKFSNQLTENEIKNSHYNELESIKHALEYLSDENSVLTGVLDDTKIASKAYIISQLLSGQSLKSEMMDRSIINTIMSAHMTRYLSFIVHISSDVVLWSDMKFDIMADIEAYSDDSIMFICKESVVASSITVLATMSDEAMIEYDFVLTKMLTDLSNRWKAEVTLGVGRLFDSLEALPKSYMGASTAIDYRLMVGTGSVIYYCDIVGNMKKITTYPYNDLELFKLAIKKGNVADIDNILNSLVKHFATNTTPIFVARGICYEIISSVVSNYEELGLDYEETFSKYPDIFSITKYESISKIIELIKLISYDVCKALSHTYDTDNKILIANMNNFINDNYIDSSFSLQSMADHYNMLPPNLSSFYKDNTRNNIFEVVTELRMNDAKELLSTSKLPINQICLKIGYDNVSSFIRRFKQFYGITPGKYREINR